MGQDTCCRSRLLVKLPQFAEDLGINNPTLLEEIKNFREQYAHEIETSLIYTSKEGAFFRGKLDNNSQKVGYGEFYQNQNAYFGKFQEDLPHGYGLAIKDEYQYYRGNFKNGLFHGNGKQYGPNYEFEGESEDGKRKKGIFKNDHFEYHGEFSENTFDGEGKIMFTNGASYQGKFRRGKFQGNGILALLNGKYYKGQFKQGKFQGKMKWMQGAKKARKYKKPQQLTNNSLISSCVTLPYEKEVTEVTKTRMQNSRIMEQIQQQSKKHDPHDYI